MEVRRNRRFDVGQKVELLYNPIQKLTNGDLGVSTSNYSDESFLSYGQYAEDYNNVNISVNDVIATPYFGGRVSNLYYNNVTIGLTYDAFGEHSANYLEGYSQIDAYIFEQKTSGYWYCLNNSGHIEENLGTAAGDNNRILDAYISNVKLKANNKTFGYGEQVFQSNWQDVVTVQVPANTPEWKLQQLVNSTATAIKGNSDLYNVIPDGSEYDEEYGDSYGDTDGGVSEWTDVANYNYYKQFSGGSCSPVVRMTNIDKPSINYNRRKNTISIDLVLLG
jgi:hypothetical protein